MSLQPVERGGVTTVDKNGVERTSDPTFNWLLVKPSVSLTTPERTTHSPAILSRAEIAQMRDERMTEQAKFTEIPPIAEVIRISPPMVEMRLADVTPIPKNRGGRPKKKV